MTMLPTSIADDEVEHVMYMYWVMLAQMESNCNPDKDILDRHMIDSAYSVLNRVAKKSGSVWCDFKPRWAATHPKMWMPGDGPKTKMPKDLPPQQLRQHSPPAPDFDDPSLMASGNDLRPNPHDPGLEPMSYDAFNEGVTPPWPEPRLMAEDSEPETK